MKAIAIGIIIILFMVGPKCFGQATMNPNYSSYVTDSTDGVNYYQTVVVDGTTTGSCSFTVVCGPNGQTCQFTDQSCANAYHYGQIENVVGTYGGTTNSPNQSPFSYMSYQTTTSIPLSSIQSGGEVPTATTGEVVCSAIGALIVVETVGKVLNTAACGPVKFSAPGVQTTCDGQTVNKGRLNIVALGNPNANLHPSVDKMLADQLTMSLSGGVTTDPGCNGATNYACYIQNFTMHGYTGNPKPSGDLTWTATACGQQTSVAEHAACK